ncbi:hypothetical protein SARI_04496 [Salmonella enterica subsp. arizonae serovar 62:z4,z23:-]|uniref:Uncharacterized protein n=1 Tax=Salmonella arizonae (strain ATCC BAA-731 / CDC346-86 / RSK2980) TaxID=41514 RepID=A9MQM6_SALAR|nr:hypothetical protein SARI_04496 [Salmonella enterica subsp. arizonae serovar 62:z4,z23:-]
MDKEMAARLLLATMDGILSGSNSASWLSAKIRVRFIQAGYHLVCLIIFRC